MGKRVSHGWDLEEWKKRDPAARNAIREGKYLLDH